MRTETNAQTTGPEAFTYRLELALGWMALYAWNPEPRFLEWALIWYAKWARYSCEEENI